MIEGVAVKKSCPKCDACYFFDHNEFPTSSAERSAHLGDSPLPLARQEFPDHFELLEYVRVAPQSPLFVSASLLRGHHGRNFRVQESAEGAIQSLDVVHTLLGAAPPPTPRAEPSVRDTDSAGVLLPPFALAWCAPHHASLRFDMAYFKWLLVTRDQLLRRLMTEGKFVCDAVVSAVTPSELSDVVGWDGAFQRVAVLREAETFASAAEGHSRRCLMMDNCKTIIIDGNHKVKVRDRVSSDIACVL